MTATRLNPLSLSVAVGLLTLDASALVPSHNTNSNIRVNANYARMRSKLLVSTSTPNNNAKMTDDGGGEDPNDDNNKQKNKVNGLQSFFSNAFVNKVGDEEVNDEDDQQQQQQQEDLIIETTGMPNLVGSMQVEKMSMGGIDEDRFTFPELRSGEVQRLFSSLEYEEDEDGVVQSTHKKGSIISAVALVSGTTIGAGVLALPHATAAAGFLPSSAALGIAWVYMTLSGLLIAELTLNRIGTSGRPGLGLLELYENSLGKNWGRVGGAAYFFLHYAILVAYIAQGGTQLDGVMESLGLSDLAASTPGMGQALFAGGIGAVLFASSNAAIQKINNVLVLGVVISFLGIVGVGSTSADFGSLINPALQHPEQVVNCFPILFLSLVYQNVVPSVVTQLEGNRSKITTSIIAGTFIPFVMFLVFNAVVLGNAISAGVDLTVEGVNPVALLQSTSGGAGNLVGNLVGGFSALAVTTTLVGLTYGLVDAWTDVFKLPTEGKDFENMKPALYALIFLPPTVMAMGNTDIFYNALDFAGAFGVSTLFLVLPPFMVWKERYGEEQTPLATKPMVPFGKIPLASMYKAAGTLIVEQGFEKLGIFDFFAEHVNIDLPHVDLPSLPTHLLPHF